MPQQSNHGQFTIQEKMYTLHTMQGRITDLHSERQERKIRVASGDDEQEFDIPWQVEVEQGHVIDVVYAVDRDQPEKKQPYYIYDRDKELIELNDTLPKPNKNFMLALLDFVLIILVGLVGARLIFSVVQDNVLWGLGALLVLMIIVYVLVHLFTYRLFFKQDLAQLKAMNSTIKKLAGSFSRR